MSAPMTKEVKFVTSAVTILRHPIAEDFQTPIMHDAISVTNREKTSSRGYCSTGVVGPIAVYRSWPLIVGQIQLRQCRQL